eukprot:CAMPEP_0113560478 /NCGR_PEP_ID=MMETSP0015_2-20120614/19452_1 /TAXON_ID=2838 /ORGANISM="Odontella" /LENGTH=581 /DNA_ID=CAMNT_0000462185 /DNA_START=140 /DNA_END=1885 /DNA_ORIENTATION=+ /assembly_acc=CAM_ASM_000160
MPQWEESYVTDATGYTSSDGDEMYVRNNGGGGQRQKKLQQQQLQQQQGGGGGEVTEESVEIPQRLATDYGANPQMIGMNGDDVGGYGQNDGYGGGDGYDDEEGDEGFENDGEYVHHQMNGGQGVGAEHDPNQLKQSSSRYGTDAQSVAYTAYTMNMTSGEQIIEELRNVGVNVLSVEGDADVFAYLDAVTAEPGEQCLLYTDDMGRVFNIVIAGGTRGLASTWETLQSTFSGWLVCCAFPLLARILAGASAIPNLNNDSSSTTEEEQDTNSKPVVGVVPGLQLMILGLFFFSETSHSWLSTSLNVRGTNSVGAYVWNSSAFLTDYPRYCMLLCLSLGAFAPRLDTPVRDALTVTGASLGLITLAANLGGRAWRKLNMGYLDGDSFVNPFLAYLSAVLAGLTFPYIGMRSVRAGSDDSDVNLSIAALGSAAGARKARQTVTLAAAIVAVVFSATDSTVVQESLGFYWSHRGTVNLAVGTWWLLSASASLAVCSRMDPARSIKIEPFLRRDETSPVGCVVPSIPNMVVEPSHRGGEPAVGGFCPILVDMVCFLVVTTLGALIIWQGVQQINGTGGESVIDVVP